MSPTCRANIVGMSAKDTNVCRLGDVADRHKSRHCQPSIWKVIEKVMVAQLSVIELHDCLHGELPKWGMGTAIMEVKLQQQLAWVEQEPLYQIYLDLRKAYDALDRGRCLEILAGYRVGPNLLRLQKQFWAKAKMVCRAGGSYGEPFGAFRGVTQGGPLSSLMFNVCVDCVVRE
jgi:hypothetical protein